MILLFGYPAWMGAIAETAAQRGMVLVEDCAQAHGTILGERMVGSFGAAAVYSFYCAHTFVAGEMGCVTTDDPSLVRTLRQVKAKTRWWKSVGVSPSRAALCTWSSVRC